MNSAKMFSSLHYAMHFPGEINSDLTGEGNLPQSPPPIYITYLNSTFVSRNSFNILNGHHSTMSVITAAHPSINKNDIGFILERYIRGLRSGELSSHCLLLRLLYGLLYGGNRLRLINTHSRSSLNRLLDRCLLDGLRVELLCRLGGLLNRSILNRCGCFVSSRNYEPSSVRHLCFHALHNRHDG